MARLWGILFGLGAASIWGGMYVVSKVVLEVIPPLTLLTLRLLLGAGALALVLWLQRRRLTGGPWRQALAVGVLGFGLSLSLQFIGTKLSTAAVASLVTSASPAFMVVFAVWLLGEPLSTRRLLALGLATVGVVAVVDPASARQAPGTFLGNLALLGAALTWGLYSVLVRKVSFRMGTLELSLLALLGGALFSAPLAVGEAALVGVGEVTTGVLLGVLYLGLVSTALAMYLWNRSLALLEAGVVSLLFFAQPVVGAGLGHLLLGEPLGRGFWLGGVLITLGLLLAAGEAAQPGQATGEPIHPSRRIEEA